MGRDENVAIFQDTEKMCKENGRLRESIKLASENQKLILEGDSLFATEKDKYDESAKIVVSKKKSIRSCQCIQRDESCCS